MNFFDIAKEQFLKDYQLKRFPKEEIEIKEAIPFSEQAMNYLQGTPFLNMIYYGKNLFICANLKIHDFLRKYVHQAKSELFRVFDAPNVFYLNDELEKYGYTIAHLAEYFLPSQKELKNERHPSIRFLHGKEIDMLYSLQGFSMALCGTTVGKRRDVLAAIYEKNHKIVGVAGCTNDCESMWQIGVDVVPEYRNQGIATELVLQLKEEIIRQGKCPFYCCAWSNVASKRVAKKAGFTPAWVELASKPLAEDWIKKIRS